METPRRYIRRRALPTARSRGNLRGATYVTPPETPIKARYLYKQQLATRRYVDLIVNKSKSMHRCPSYQNNGNFQPSGGVYNFSVGANIGKGDDVGSRTGDAIEVVKLHIHGHVFNYNTSPFQSGAMRMLVVRSKFPWETLTDDFFMSDSASAVPDNFTTNQRGSITRMLNPNKFTVVWDKVIPLAVWNDQDHDQTRKKNHTCGGMSYFSYRIPLKKKIKFEDGGTSASDIMPCYKVIWWVVSNYHNPAADFPTGMVGHQFYIDTYFRDI